MKHIRKKSESGNVLFYILIGVVLFGALSFAVSNMMRGASTSNLSAEKIKLYGDEIMAYGRTLQQAVRTVQISGGCEDEDISFSNAQVSGYAHSPVVSSSCKIFDRAGGGAVYAPPLPTYLDQTLSPVPSLHGEWYFPANVCVEDVGNGGSGCATDSTDNEELVAILPYIKQDICEAINTRAGLNVPAPTETGDGWPDAETKFTGSFADGTELDQSEILFGCFQGSSGNTPEASTYHFFQVLKRR